MAQELKNAAGTQGKRPRRQKIRDPENIIKEIRQKYNNGEIPRNSEDSFMICRCVAVMLDGAGHWKTEESIFGYREDDRRFKFTPEQIETMTKRRKAGDSTVEIARDLGLEPFQVQKYCARKKIYPPWGKGKKHAVLDFEKIEQMRAEGKTWQEVGDVFGCSIYSAQHQYKRWKMERGIE